MTVREDYLDRFSHWEIGTGRYVGSIRFDPDTGQMFPNLPAPEPGDEVEWWTTVPPMVRKHLFTARVSTVLCQRAVNHPADHGLTPAPWPESGTLYTLRHQVDYRRFGEEASSVEIPDHESRTMWVAEGADPQQYGTVYTAAVGVEEDFNITTRWQMGLCGTSTILTEADWDDAEGCAAMFASVAESLNNSDAYTVQGALVSDPEQWAADRVDAARRIDKAAAIETFKRHPRFRVKPRLLQEATTGASYRHGPLQEWLKSNEKHIFAIPVTVKGGPSAYSKNLHIAVKIDVSRWIGYLGETIPEEYVDGFAAELHPILEQNQLGQLFYYRDGSRGRTLTVVKNPQKAFTHSAIIGIPEGGQIFKYTGGNPKWQLYTTATYPNLDAPQKDEL